MKNQRTMTKLEEIIKTEHLVPCLFVKEENGEALKTPSIDGWCLPEDKILLWDSVSVFSEPIDPAIKAAGGFRGVRTSMVVKIEGKKGLLKLVTNNSVYLLMYK